MRSFRRRSAVAVHLDDMTQINKLIREAEVAANTTVYMDYGANEINFHAVMRKQFRKVTDLLLSREVLLTSRIVQVEITAKHAGKSRFHILWIRCSIRRHFKQKEDYENEYTIF